MRTLLLIALLFLPAPALAAVERPEFDPQLGRQIDTGLVLTDETGKAATLAKIVDGRTALILFGHHNCPNQCGVAQQVIAGALAQTGLGSRIAPLFITLA